MKQNLKFLGWDGTKFDNPQEALEYNWRAYKNNFNTIQFFCYRDYDSFDLIPSTLYEDMAVNMQIYHSSDLFLFYYYLKKAPIVYCHDESAAAVMNGLCGTKDLSVGKFEVGFTYFSDKGCKFLPFKELPDEIFEAPAFKKLLETMNHFIKENVA